jgi:hypothetical protein
MRIAGTGVRSSVQSVERSSLRQVPTLRWALYTSHSNKFIQIYVALAPIYILRKTRHAINKQMKIGSMNKVIIFLCKSTSKSHLLAKRSSARAHFAVRNTGIRATHTSWGGVLLNGELLQKCPKARLSTVYC